MTITLTTKTDLLYVLKLVPFSLWLELVDITFLVNFLTYPQEHFDIFEYIQFVSSTTLSSSHSKLKCLLPQSTNNHLNFIYFNQVVKLWNALPKMDLELSILSLKKSLKKFPGVILLVISILTLHVLGTIFVLVVLVFPSLLP